jgi:hypothetical protein
MNILVCKACGGVLVFGEHGWEHRDSIHTCSRATVAWPPPREDDGDEPLAEAG